MMNDKLTAIVWYNSSKLYRTYRVEASASVDALDPERSHITLLIATIPVGVLKGLLHPLPGDSYAVLCPTSKPLRKLEHLRLVHLPPSLRLFCQSILSTLDKNSICSLISARRLSPDLNWKLKLCGCSERPVKNNNSCCPTVNWKY